MGSKDRFARELLVNRGMPASEANAIPQGDAFSKAVAWLGETPEEITTTLYATHNVGQLWLFIGGIGIVSAIGIYLYGRWILTLKTSSVADAL